MSSALLPLLAGLALAQTAPPRAPATAPTPTSSVLSVSGKGEYPYFNAQQMYLDGFRFE